MKKCRKCGISKELEGFYRHPSTKDGYLNQCKLCISLRNKKRRLDNPTKLRERDRKRDRSSKRREWRIKNQKLNRKKNPQKYRARNAVHKALRSGKLVKQPCQHCGNSESEAHHPDYTKPLDITWLCFECHREEHRNDE